MSEYVAPVCDDVDGNDCIQMEESINVINKDFLKKCAFFFTYYQWVEKNALTTSISTPVDMSSQ